MERRSLIVKRRSRPVSPSVVDSHSSRRSVTAELEQPWDPTRGRVMRSLWPRSGAAVPFADSWSCAMDKVAEPAGKPGSVVDSHSSRRSVTAELEQPTRTRRGPRHEVPIWPCSRWGLPCRPVARLAVRSCRTISPLPRIPKNRSAVSFCCTFRRLAPPRRYLAPCPVEPGLSSASEDDATVWPTPPRALSHTRAITRLRHRTKPCAMRR